jgi:CHAT domain-containing protein
VDARSGAGAPPVARAFEFLSPLPDTADEVREIADVLAADPRRDLYLGRRATESAVKSADLAQYRTVMFATHGLVPSDLRGLFQPALALANPALGREKEDGLLTLEEILGLKLSADWVVLSACNTASPDGRAQESVSGLGRGFFYAGARALLVSNWPVESESARLLTTEMFRRQKEREDISRAQALREAELALMEREAKDDRGRPAYSYAHPMFWAPFSLVGDGSGGR